MKHLSVTNSFCQLHWLLRSVLLLFGIISTLYVQAAHDVANNNDVAPTITDFTGSPATVCIGQLVTVTATATINGVTGPYNYTLIDVNDNTHIATGTGSSLQFSATINTGETSYRFETIRLTVQASNSITSETTSYEVRPSNFGGSYAVYYDPGQSLTIQPFDACSTGQWAFSTGVTASSLVIPNPTNGLVISATCTEAVACPLQVIYYVSESVVPTITGDQRSTCLGSPLSVTISCPNGNAPFIYRGGDDLTYTTLTDIAANAKVLTILANAPARIYYANPVCMGNPYPISLTVVEPPTFFGVTASNSGVLTCSQSVVTLTPNAYPVDRYTLLPGSQTAAFGESFTVSAAQTYTVIASLSGCSSQTTISVTQSSDLPVTSLTASNGGVISCLSPSVTLTAAVSGTGGSYSFAFAGSALSGSNPTAGTALASQSGMYSVTATNLSTGCSSVRSVTITGNTIPPSLSLSASNSGTLTCINPTLTLLASGGSSYTLSGPGLSSTTGTQAIVNQPGAFTVVGLGANSCSATATTTVFSNTVTPTISSFAASGVLSCSQTSVMLITSATYSGTLTYSVSGLGLSANPTLSNTLTVGQPGIYAVIVRGNTGCSASAITTVTADVSFTATSMQVSVNGLLSGASSVTISAQLSGVTNYTLISSNGYGATAADGQFVVSQPGLYTVLAQNSGGCLVTGTATVPPGSPPLVPNTFEATNMLTCPQPGQPSPTAGLVAVATGTVFIFTGPNGYAYSNVYREPGTYNVMAEGITQAGSYTLTVFNQGVQTGVYTNGVSSTCTSGTAVAGGGRRALTSPLRITLSTNPLATEVVSVAVEGASGQSLLVEVFTKNGVIVDKQRFNQARPIEVQNLHVGRERGSFYLKISTPTTEKTVWLAR